MTLTTVHHSDVIWCHFNPNSGEIGGNLATRVLDVLAWWENSHERLKKKKNP